MNKIVIDFETRSALDLKKVGPWKYAAHESTDVICLSAKVTGKIAKLWVPPWIEKIIPDSFAEGQRLTKPVLTEQMSVHSKEAHNLEFERAVWHYQMHKKYGFPDLSLNECECSAALAATHALPRQLEKLAKVLKLSKDKDMEGHKTMLKICKPRKANKAEKKRFKEEGIEEIEDKVYYGPDGVFYLWHESPEDITRVCEYCLRDSEVEALISSNLKNLTKKERKVWLLDQKINRRGVYLDVKNIENIIETLGKHEKDLLQKFSNLTGGYLDSPRQVQKMKDWLQSYGISTENLQKNTVNELVDNLEKEKGPKEVIDVLKIRQQLSKASTSKFQAMVNRVEDDGRARSLFMYAGAGTGRWTSKAIQLQNLVRDSYKDDMLEAAYKAFEKKDPEIINLLFEDPFHAASKCLRGCIKAAPGNVFFCADYSSIEARGNAWQAEDETLLDDFRRGVCVYSKAGAATFNTTYEKVKEESGYMRLVGKVQILSMGYEGGIGAYASMAKNYNIDLETLPEIILPYATADELEGKYGAISLSKAYLKKNPETMSLKAAVACDVIKRKWRSANSPIVASWKYLNEAAIKAVKNPGKVFVFNKVKFGTWKSSGGHTYLLCQLPSGRFLFYFDPRIMETKNELFDNYKATLTCMTVANGQWVRRPLYGGLLCENVVQAFCRDILAEAMIRLEAKKYWVVMHVHDECVSEVKKGFGDLKEFEDIMSEVPDWAFGLPVKAKGWTGERFRK